MEWGTYKPNQFFGIKNRHPQPVTVGMLWAVPDQVRRTMDVRHSYKYQGGDGIIAYYEYHDGWSFAREIIEDNQSNARIEIDWIKSMSIIEEKDIKSSWKAIITVKPINQNKVVAINPFFYLSCENAGFQLQQISNPSQNDTTKVLKILRDLKNSKSEFESFEFKNIGDEEAGFTVMGLEIQNERLWDVEDFFKKNLRDMILGGQANEKNSNFISLRIPQPMPKEFKFMISYVKKSYRNANEAKQDSILMKDSVDQLVEDFEILKKLKIKQFDTKFQSVFNLSQEKFDTDEYLRDFKDQGLAFSREALSNLLGGIGYYYGPLLVKKKNQKDGAYDEATALFTGCPSRNRFPRGFLWDEGFHLMVTCQWSKLICMDIISHWFNTMKPNGWIPREQIRGSEAESAVPREFIVQDPKVANPPSMMFPMKYLISQSNNGNTKVTAFLGSLYTRWQKWYDWFFKSQENPSMPNTFSWRGRTSQENLPSGLDDYPRAYIVNEEYEIHLDLQSWMVEFSKFMADFAELVQDERMQQKYQDKAINIKQELHDKLFNKNINLYCDYVGLQFQPKLDANGNYAEPIEWRLDHKCGRNAVNSLKQPAKCNHPYGEDEYLNQARCCRQSQCVVDPQCNCPGCEYHASIDDDYNVQLMNQFSLHEGIINFFPIMFGLIDDQDQLSSSLRDLADQNKMLGNSGIRSLSKTDQFFLHGSNYWRGAVWINVNYLVVRGLFKYYQSMLPFVDDSSYYSKTDYDFSVTNSNDLYQTIRQRLIKAIYMNWRINHLFYEQYDQENGLGLFTNPFTGWTTLILLITSEKYI